MGAVECSFHRTPLHGREKLQGSFLFSILFPFLPFTCTSDSIHRITLCWTFHKYPRYIQDIEEAFLLMYYIMAHETIITVIRERCELSPELHPARRSLGKEAFALPCKPSPSVTHHSTSV